MSLGQVTKAAVKATGLQPTIDQVTQAVQPVVDYVNSPAIQTGINLTGLRPIVNTAYAIPNITTSLILTQVGVIN